MSPPLRALVSVHDVMPHTLAAVAEVLARLSAAGIERATLFVVPGLDWSAAQRRQLADWAGMGHELAAHGWLHRAERIRGWRHRLHARLISRNVAEHMALDADGILALMRRSRAWFAAHALPTPSLYVPPAWALGPVDPQRLATSGFARIETLAGVLDVRTGGWQRLPLVGFEADTALRALALTLNNAAQRQWARIAPRRPLRIAIHPQDFQLRCAHALDAALRDVGQPSLYRELQPLRGARTDDGTVTHHRV